MRTLAIAALMLAALPAQAQRSAVSAELSPEMAGAAFSRAVMDVCVPAVAGSGVSSLGAAREGKVSPTQDAVMRRQAGAEADETVWDVAEARGVVTVREKAGRCVVSVYGAEVLPTFEALERADTEVGFKRSMYMSPGAGIPVSHSTFLEGELQGKKLKISVIGVEPGTPGHQSRFSVVTATVSLAQ